MFTTMRQGAISVVSAAGPLNIEHTETAREHLEACISKGLPRLVFDLEHVQLLDSAALELLLDIRDRCAEKGGALTLAAPSALCRDILRATDLERRLTIFDNVQAAVGSFAQ